MKNLLIFSLLIFAVPAYAGWSIKPYAQISGGFNNISEKYKNYEVHHWQNWAYADAHYYFIYPTELNTSGDAFGMTYEIGGEFRYKWFYSALGINYNTAGSTIKDWSMINARIGGTYDRFTPYLKIGALLHNKTKYGKMNPGISSGIGLAVKITDNLYWENSYYVNQLKSTADLSSYYAANNDFITNMGGMGTEEQMEYFMGQPNIRLQDEQIQDHKFTNNTFRTGIKYTF